jgi:type I restriction enzyme, S subunit
MRHPSYPEYKESGVQWLGNVPEYWEVKRSDGIVFSDRNQVQPDNFKDEDVFHYSIPAVQEYGTGVIEDGESIASAKQAITEKCLLVSKLNPRKATICVAEPQEKKTLCSTEFVVLRARRCRLSYLAYFTQTEPFRQELDSKVQSVTRSHQRAAPDDIYKFWAAWPSLPEQTAIADFLDRETGRIDKLVAKKRRLIELLREKRSALISRTVTSGLPADAAREFGLEPHFRFKDSGIDWLGEVPEGWEVKRLSYIAFLKSGENIISEQIAEGGSYPVYGGNGLRGYYSSYTHDGLYVLIGRQGALCGNINYAEGKFWASEHAIVVNSLTNFAVKWIGELLRAMNLNQYSVSAAQPGLSVSQIGSLKIPVPPLPEQTAIATWLDRETSKIDRLVEKIEAAVGRLQEYRTALITAAVTGKIDVRKTEITKGACYASAALP